jgi:hypothetical protein
VASEAGHHQLGAGAGGVDGEAGVAVAAGGAATAGPPPVAGSPVREAAHNLARIYESSGADGLARQVMRRYCTVA